MTNTLFFYENLARGSIRDCTDHQYRRIAETALEYERDGGGTDAKKSFGVWHAASEVLNQKCGCTRCNAQQKGRHNDRSWLA